MDEKQGPADLGVLKRSEPSGLLCVLLDPRADRLDDQDVGEPRHHRFAAGTELFRLRRHEAQGALDPLHPRRARGFDVNDRGKERHELMGRGMVEADHSAHQARALAASAMAENRIAVVHVVVGKGVDARRRNPRLARKNVSSSMGNQSQVAGHQPSILHSREREPAVAGRHHVKAQAVRERRELDGPGGRKLGPNVEHSGHPEEMESLSEGIGRPSPMGHRAEYPPVWTVEQETATNGP